MRNVVIVQKFQIKIFELEIVFRVFSATIEKMKICKWNFRGIKPFLY